MKHIVKFANTTNVSGETISEPTSDVTTGAPAWSADKSSFSRMNVILDVKTLTGTSPTITFTVSEKFGGVFAQTAKSKGISATGTYILEQGAVPPGQSSVLNDGAFWALGSGSDKQVVTTAGGTVGTLNADIYFAFFE